MPGCTAHEGRGRTQTSAAAGPSSRLPAFKGDRYLRGCSGCYGPRLPAPQAAFGEAPVQGGLCQLMLHLIFLIQAMGMPFVPHSSLVGRP